MLRRHRTRQARPARTTGGYKAETILETPLVQVEFFRNQHEGDLRAAVMYLLVDDDNYFSLIK